MSHLRTACLSGAVALAGLRPTAEQADLRASVERRIAASGAEAVGVYFRRRDGTDSLLVSAAARFHAASTMKVPVMIQILRDADQGRLRLDDRLLVRKTFRSIVDGSPYDLDPGDDSDSTLYRRAGDSVTVRELMELMITVSSNLATNLLIDLVGADRADRTAHQLGADSIAVRRGVEDIPAFRAGLNNTTTARDLGVLFTAIAQERAASPSACREMLAILERQHFNERIPAGLPPGTRVAHKTGEITAVSHDAAIVFPRGGPPYVLVVLTRGLEDQRVAARLIADISALVYRQVMQAGS